MGMLNAPQWDGKLRRNYQESLEIPAKTGKGSLTKQSFKDECDINTIVRKYSQTGVLTHVRTTRPMFGDFTKVSSYQEALNAVMAAQDSFMTLDPKIRARFGNDPQQFLDFIDDPSNLDEARRLGLVPPEKPTGGSRSRSRTLQGTSTASGQQTNGEASTAPQNDAITQPNANKGHA